MNNYEKIYWLTRLDGINTLFRCMYILSIAFIILIVVLNTMSQDFDENYKGDKLKEREKLRKSLSNKIKYLVFTMIIGALGSIFLPTQKQAVLIIAGGKTIDYIQSDTSLSKLPQQTTLLISTILDEKIKELEDANQTKRKD